MIALYTLLIAAAAFRGYRILASDLITEPLRDWLYTWTDGIVHPPSRLAAFVADLFTCPWCIGFWYAGIGAALVAWQEGYTFVEFGLVWFAASTVCGLLGKLDR